MPVPIVMDVVRVSQVILPSGEPIKFDRWGVETAGDLRRRVLRSSADKFVKVFLIYPDGSKLEDHIPLRIDAGEGSIALTAVFARLMLHEAIEAAESMMTVDSFDLPTAGACKKAECRPSFQSDRPSFEDETEPRSDSSDNHGWTSARSEATSLHCDHSLEAERACSSSSGLAPGSSADAAPKPDCETDAEPKPDSEKDADSDQARIAAEILFMGAREIDSCEVCNGSGVQGFFCHEGLGLWKRPCRQCDGLGFHSY